MNMMSINSPQGSEPDFKKLDDTRALELLTQGPSYSPWLPSPKPRILIVEDEIMIQKMLKRSLEIQIPCQIKIANHGIEAIDHILNETFDLVLTDMQMPQMTGLELFEWIRINAPSLTDRFLIMSGDLGGAHIAEQCNHYGLEVVRKPFNIQVIKNKVLEYLERNTSIIT